MKALSIHQPWLYSMTVLQPPDRKEVENRPRRPPESMIGKRFALHATKTWDHKGLLFFHRLGVALPPNEGMPFGAITALAVIDRVADARDAVPESQRRYFFGRYGYVLRDVVNLPRPVYVRGMQGFWPVPPNVEREVLGLLATAAP